jgi:MoxR-like ATPase
MLVQESERLRAAAGRFVAFFRELQTHYIERDDLLTQIALSLLQREHTLMTGPPGTAKSSLAHAVLGRIVCERAGEPSLFARQFTESTVQTDLVGPIDFKTLMETGRTEHFTDEGMLGAMHAFLDEVFDGRDMLLRSTLNVLQERELKQGTKTTRGGIECALMTSNRYLAETLERSSEALLAFVDRIAFISFVPRGFADPSNLERVLRIQVAGTSPPPLSAPLTIEDLDALQDATESVFVSERLTDQLAAFVATFEREIEAARRADPSFMPTRCRSTRSLVRLGRMLRSICVYDWAFNDRERMLAARQGDFALLRLGLLLSGPSLRSLGELLRSETDPRERRQLAIMQTEREIFDRCFARLPRREQEENIPQVDTELLASAAADELARHQDEALLDLARRLSHAATSGRLGASLARSRLGAAIRELTARAFRSGMAGGHDAPGGLIETLTHLTDLADDIDEAGSDQSGVARWLRSRTLESVYRAMELGPTTLGSGLQALLATPASSAEILTNVHGRLQRPRDLAALRARLLSRGAQEPDPAKSAERWKVSLERVLEEVVVIWDDGLRAASGRALASVPKHELVRFLQALLELLQRLRESATTLDELGADGEALVNRVVGPFLRPYVEASFKRFDAHDRKQVAAQVSRVLALLESSGVQGAVAPSDLVLWSAAALLRADAELPDLPNHPNYDSYRTLRQAVPRASLAYTLLDICLCIAPDLGRKLEAPPSAVARLGGLLQHLPGATRDELIARDLARMDWAIETLERWFDGVAAHLPTDPADALVHLAKSRFYEVTRDESALTRFALEARLVRDVFPTANVRPLLNRLADLERKSWGLVQQTAAARTQQAWQKTLEGWQGSS